MRKDWRKQLISVASLALIPLVILLLIQFTPKPPVSEMEYARATLSKAGISKADTYSRKLFTDAKVFYDSAMVNWQRENEKFIFFRNYDKVAMFAELSAKKSEQATENSISNSSDLKIKLNGKIDSLNDLVAEINDLFTSYPLTSEIRTRISKGKLLLREGELAYKRGQYLLATNKITDSEYLLSTSYENASTNLKNYFKSYPVWKNLMNKAIIESRQNRDYSIIVDKFSRKCFVYYNGVRKYEYDVELGKNWVGDKRLMGDKATPEGLYKIIKKIKDNNNYYKALLLDYPNDKDKERFKAEVKLGSLPANAKIGGGIEIHGNGGKGIDWTEGCIALTDSEMDVIFKIAKVGTPVTIIGSMNDLKHILNR